MSRAAVKRRNRTQRRMKASTRHKHHGKPQARQKRGRAATRSHRLNPNEKRHPKALRPVAPSRCTAPTHGPGVASTQKAPKERHKVLQVSFRCPDCSRELDYEGQLCTGRWCDGRAVRKEQWVEASR